MSNTSAIKLPLLLLCVLAAGRAAQLRKDSTDLVLARSLRGFAQALMCLGGVVQDSQRLHKRNDSSYFQSMEVLEALTDLINRQHYEQNVNINSIKEELAALHNEEKFAQDNVVLRIKVLEQRHKIQDLEQRLLSTDKENQENVNKVQDLESKLKESQRRTEEMAERIEFLNHNENECAERNNNLRNQLEEEVRKVGELSSELNRSRVEMQALAQESNRLKEKLTPRENDAEAECQFAEEKENIRKLVREYDRTKNWRALREGLEATLDEGSEAHMQVQSIEYGSSIPLYWIGYLGDQELVEALVTCGGAVDAEDVDGQTLLHGAAESGDLKLTAWLLKHGAEVEAHNDAGWTPLMFAASHGKLEVAMFLVQRGASTAARDYVGRTAFDLAENNNRTSVAHYLSQLPH